jgi:hypothetical protein
VATGGQESLPRRILKEGEESLNDQKNTSTFQGNSQNGATQEQEAPKLQRMRRNLIPLEYVQVATQGFQDEPAELLRQELGIQTVLEASGLAGKEISNKEIARHLGIEAEEFTRTDQRHNRLHEFVWYRIFKWYKKQMKKADKQGLKGLAILSDRKENLKVWFVEFTNFEDIKLANHALRASQGRARKFTDNDGNRCSINQLLGDFEEKEIKGLVRNITLNLQPGETVLGVDAWEIRDTHILRYASDTNSYIPITKLGPTIRNAYRLAFVDVLDFDIQDPKWSSFIKRTDFNGYRKTSSTTVKGKLTPLHAFLGINNGLTTVDKKLPKWRIGWNRIGEVSIWKKDLSKGRIYFKGSVRDMPRSAICDAYHSKNITGEAYLTVKRDLEELIGQPVITGNYEANKFIEFLDNYRNRFEAEDMANEEFYQFILEAAYRYMIDKFEEDGQYSRKLQKIVTDGKWEFLTKYALTNLDKGVRTWKWDHLNVYRSKESSGYLLVFIEDKFWQKGRQLKTDPSRGSFVETADRLEEDIRSLHESTMDIVMDTKGKWGREGGLNSWQSFDKKHRKIYTALRADVIDNPAAKFNVIACSRVAEIVEDSTTGMKGVHISLNVWEPPMSNLFYAARRLHQASGEIQKFGKILTDTLRLMQEAWRKNSDAEVWNLLSFSAKSFWTNPSVEKLTSSDAYHLFSILKQSTDLLTKEVTKIRVHKSEFAFRKDWEPGYDELDRLYDQLQLLQEQTQRISFNSPN